MRFKTLVLHNYGPFQGEHTFELYKRGLVLVRGDNRDEARMNSNGSGKSSLVECMDWCLFGAVPRGDVVDSVVHKGERECTVAITSQDDEGNNVRVIRTRLDGRQSLRLIWNDEDVSSLDARETQRHIEWHLGLDRQVFHSTVLFAQNELFCFADAVDTERMAILTKILRMEDIDAWADSAKKLKDDARYWADEAREQLRDVNTQLFTLDALSPEKQSRNWQAQHAEQGQALLVEQSQLTEQLKQMGERPELVQDLAAPPEFDAAHTEFERVAGEHTAALSEVATRQAEVNRLQALAALGPSCPTCEQAIPAERAQDTDAGRQRAEQALAHARSVEQSMHAKVGDATRRRSQMQVKVREMQAAAMSAYCEARTTYERAEEALAACSQRLAHHDQQTDPFAEQCRDLQQKVASLTEQKATATATKDNAEAALSDFEWWVAAFNQRGLKSYILDARLAEMNEAANYWVKMLTGGSIWVRMENVTTLKSGVSRNRFNIRVFRQEPDGTITERGYRSWSGGEKRRISLGIDFGLSRLVARRANKPWSLMVLDEVFRHLDAAGRDAAMQMLQHLREEKETILVVDHDAEFQSLFETTVTVRKTNGCATILEGDQADERSAEPVPRRADSAAEGQPVVSQKGHRSRRGGRAGRASADKRA